MPIFGFSPWAWGGGVSPRAKVVAKRAFARKRRSSAAVFPFRTSGMGGGAACDDVPHNPSRAKKAKMSAYRLPATLLSNHTHNPGIHFAYSIAQLINVALVVAGKEDGLAVGFQALDEVAHFANAVLIEAV